MNTLTCNWLNSLWTLYIYNYQKLMHVTSYVACCHTDISHFQLHVTSRTRRLVAMSKHITGICWYTASKKHPCSSPCFTFPPRASHKTLHDGVISLVLTESLNIQCRKTIMFTLKMKWPPGDGNARCGLIVNGLKRIYEIMIYAHLLCK